MIISYNPKATGPVVIKFYVEPPGTEGTKMFENFRSHDQHAAMPMYGKNLFKCALEPTERWL